MTHIDLFAGIGGFSHGAKSAGITTIECVEINKWRQKQLEKIHNDKAKIYGDINTWHGQYADIFTIGFPCQDISHANKDGKGLEGKRSGLFYTAWEKAMLFRPKYIILENVANLANRGLFEVFATITQSGYDIEWHNLRASDFGFPHKRERIFIIAYTHENRRACSRIFRPPETISLSQKWSSNETLLLLSTGRANEFADTPILRSCDVVPDFRKWLAGLGDSVLPIIAEYIFKCIILHYESSK